MNAQNNAVDDGAAEDDVVEVEDGDVRLSLLDVTNFNSIEARRARDASLCEEADMKRSWPLVVLLRAAPRSSVLPCYS